MIVNVIGLGYIGLPTALMFAANVVKVAGTDYNKELIETLKSGKLTFEENERVHARPNATTHRALRGRKPLKLSKKCKRGQKIVALKGKVLYTIRKNEV